MNILYVIRQRRRALLTILVAAAAIYFGYQVFASRQYTAYAQVSDYNSRANGRTANVDVNSPYLAPLRSNDLIQKVAASLNDADRARLTAAYSHWLHWGPGPGAVQILMVGRQISAAEGMVDVGFQHPDPAIAALVANAMAAEFVRESNAGKEDRMNQSLADLETREKAQQDKVDGLRKQMEDMAKQYGDSNLDPAIASVYLNAISDLNKQLVQYKNTVDTLQLHVQQIKDQVNAKKTLLELDFIRSQPSVAQLYASAQALSNHVEEMRAEGFQPEAPDMLEAQDNLKVAMNELNSAVQTTVSQLIADLQVAGNNLTEAAKNLQSMQAKNQELSSARNVYQGLQNDYKTANDVLGKTKIALSDAETKFNLTDPAYVVLAQAEAPTSADPLPWAHIGLTSAGVGVGCSLLVLLGFTILRPPPKQEREEYERRRRRHRHFNSSHHRSSSHSKSSSESSSSSRRRH